MVEAAGVEPACFMYPKYSSTSLAYFPSVFASPTPCIPLMVRVVIMSVLHFFPSCFILSTKFPSN